MFVSLFFLALFLSIYFHNRKTLFFIPTLTKNHSLSVLVPAYNEQNTIEGTIEHIFASDYKGLLEVIAINDGSTDNTLQVLSKLQKKYKKLVVINKANSGKASSLNYALKLVKGDFVAIIDADSYPDKKAFSQLMGFFSDQKVGAVTAACTPMNRKSLLERLQTIEFKVIAFTRKLLEYIDSIYVAPGSLSVYRLKALKEAGGFDSKNLTEDIESTWHLLSMGWKVKMCLAATVRTVVPNTFKAWWIQRVRWTVGGFQVLKKYRKDLFKKGMFGYFVIPFFIFGLTIGILGVGIFFWIYMIRLFQRMEIVFYKMDAGVPLVALQDLNITPSVLNYFGIVLFIIFFLFTIFVLMAMKDDVLKKQKTYEILLYSTMYLIAYPFMIIWSVYKWSRGYNRWR